MVRKNKAKSDFGRCLIKGLQKSHKGKKFVENSMLHTTELSDGYDWGRLNLQSVTEESSFQEFLATAELAGTEYQMEKLNIKYVRPLTGILTKDEIDKINETHLKHKEYIKIPRRPKWDNHTTHEQLDLNEKEAFLDWRRSLAKLQENEDIILTPYEKNLEFWRQLWRVIEKSDVLVQVVDARNPLLFRCEDLELYVKEVSEHKINLILINKADFLTENQRQLWADYFTSKNIKVVFYSAALALEEMKNISTIENPELKEIQKKIEKLDEQVDATGKKLNEILDNLNILNTSELLTRDRLIEIFKVIHKGSKVTTNLTTIGMVGYPNVGKSSTINSLIREKKISVSATPGKTKHFQTLYLDSNLMLCDCPGLVMPSFVHTKAEMIINGILPIDQMRDYVSPVNLLSSFMPRFVLEDTYGIILPLPQESEDPDRSATAEELLDAYALNRGFMTANGQPDNARASRYILKDFVNGKLLYCHSPPEIKQIDFHQWIKKLKKSPSNKIEKSNKPVEVISEFDKKFFNETTSGVHYKGRNLIISSAINGEKPWKKFNKHHNKNKKEKLRKVYAYLDKH